MTMMKLWYARREGWAPQAEDARLEADVDYARIIHSASFRRLQGKTQILNLGDSDFYRTRLTHSLEVAQIAGGIARQFAMLPPEHPVLPYLPDLSMIQAAGATHDLGHPPFGHGGEVALNYCMRDHGGFEGNGQTLRIVSRLEKFSNSAGANLTRRTMLSLLKYPAPYSAVVNGDIVSRLDPAPKTLRIIERATSKPPKCYLDSEQEVVDWVLAPLSDADRSTFTSVSSIAGKHGKTRHKSFDCSIMDVADDIAFGVHDLEDALALGLINESDFRRYVPEHRSGSFLDHLKERYPSEFANDVYGGFVSALFGEGGRRKRFIGRMVHHLITNCRIVEVNELDEPLIRYRAVMADGPAELLDALKEAVREIVILSPSVQQLEFKGQTMIVSVFEAFSSEPRSFLPRDTFLRWEQSDTPERVICDHIAGMTDVYLLRTYERLFAPRMGSVFDRV
ncbi:anti-phage deoxyguanosine triphosphatase [Sphingomonas sp. PAMC26645]|uniref:anti-phage deoxyguanosine triphosphatase n=1 Tax=Sphingomonas sp. PAMC26645 TaxID=2565555 RepID=UPI001FF9B8C8|nr:anti-phage deoxyguanosine triphosphatase [Sphingomonas sp. PAMC26645]